jgi:hypothetical protein
MPRSITKSLMFAGLFLAFPLAFVAVAYAVHPKPVAAAPETAASETAVPVSAVPVPAVPVPAVPVLVELFTSEGCSSCPPADALLARLDAQQPVPGAQVIALSEHVTYWNSLGWRDPFSSEAMTQRQQQYASHFGLGEVYTPQVVVDGAAELVGSDERGLTRAIAKAAGQPKAALTIEHAEVANGVVRFTLKSKSSTGEFGAHVKVFAAIAQDSAEAAVSRGENGGRTLHHVAVVRSLEAMGKGSADGRELTLKLPANQVESSLRLVAFLVDQRSGRVSSAAVQELGR